MEKEFVSTGDNCIIACSLTDEAFKRRKEKIASSIVSKIIDTEELEKGYQYSFPYSPEVLIELTEFINVERECCPFINFHLILHSNSNNLVLLLTGDEGTKDFIKYELELI